MLFMIVSYREDGKLTKSSNMRVLTHILVYDYMLKISEEEGSNEINYVRLIDDVAKQLQYNYFPGEMLYNLRLSVIGSVTTMVNAYGLMWFRDLDGNTYIEFDKSISDGSVKVEDWVKVLKGFKVAAHRIDSSVIGLERYFGRSVKYVVKKLGLSDISDLLIYLIRTKAYLRESNRQQTMYYIKYKEAAIPINVKSRYELSVNKGLYGHEPFLKYMKPAIYLDRNWDTFRKVG